MTVPKMHIREVQVLTLAAEGLTAKQSAKRIDISHQTVRKWRQSAIEKLGAATVTQAVAILMRAGVLK